jgi:hypothetical protein
MPSIPPPAYSTLPPTVMYTTAPQPQVRPAQQVLYPQYQYPAHIIVQPSPTFQNPYPATPIFFYPTFSSPAYTYNFQTPPPFPPYPPGQVPPWYPRQTRYELIRGVLTPIEHFAAPLPLSLHLSEAGTQPPVMTMALYLLELDLLGRRVLREG